MGIFKRKENETLKSIPQDEKEAITANEILPCEEWIWVEGYKATEYDMTCKGYQYTLGETHSLPENENVVLCKNGFHFCLEKDSLRRYYNYGRVFKVKGLVKKTDYDWVIKFSWDPYSTRFDDKFVARSIVFLEELSAEETRKCFGKITYVSTDEDWLEFLKIGYSAWIKLNECRLKEKFDLTDTLFTILTFKLTVEGRKNFLEYCAGLADSGVSRDMFIFMITEKSKELNK